MKYHKAIKKPIETIASTYGCAFLNIEFPPHYLIPQSLISNNEPDTMTIHSNKMRQDKQFRRLALSSFHDEMEKNAVLGTAALIAMGKISLTNTIHRHGDKIRIPFTQVKPIKWAAKEIAGVGARTGMQGKPMLHRVTREALALSPVGDPKLTKLYEMSHRIGKGIAEEKQHPGLLTKVKSAIGIHPETERAKLVERLQASHKNIPEITQAADFAKSIPLESKGWRKSLDYTFNPVSEVGKDIKGVAISAREKLRHKLMNLKAFAINKFKKPT